jgi:hypothetical protein
MVDYPDACLPVAALQSLDIVLLWTLLVLAISRMGSPALRRRSASVHTVKRASSTEDLAVRIGIATGRVVVGEPAGTGDQSKLAVGQHTQSRRSAASTGVGRPDHHRRLDTWIGWKCV